MHRRRTTPSGSGLASAAIDGTTRLEVGLRSTAYDPEIAAPNCAAGNYLARLDDQLDCGAFLPFDVDFYEFG